MPAFNAQDANRFVCDSSADGEYVSTRRGTSDVIDFQNETPERKQTRRNDLIFCTRCVYTTIVPFLVNINDFHRLYLSVWNANYEYVSSIIFSLLRILFKELS